jgi:hypothetical protein
LQGAGFFRLREGLAVQKLFLLAGLAIAAFPAAAFAHNAPDGWAYDPRCCGGHDCHPIPADEVRVTPDGYLVTIPASDTAAALRRLFHYHEVLESGDGQYHACIIPGSGEFRCFYVPPLGF